jgi:signal peptidase I
MKADFAPIAARPRPLPLIMFFLTPKYVKQARLLHKGVKRFVNYKRDLLPASKVDEITGMNRELAHAVKTRDEKRVAILSDQLTKTCQLAMPDARHSEIADNVEVFFVAIVIALGIRSYIAQPFQIPTASMQPTLNGYMAEATKEDPTPNILKRIWDKTSGKTYINVVSDHTGYLDPREPITEHRFLLIFTYSKINFADGHSIRVWAPKRQLEGRLEAPREEERGLGFWDYLGAQLRVAKDAAGNEILTPDANRVMQVAEGRYLITEGQLLARGILRTGDHVIVNKFAYNFRRPERGEVFVFTTSHISGIAVPKEQGSQHYIKRLVGTPGDSLEVRGSKLWVNGKEGEEFGIQRVGNAQAPYKGYTSYGYLDEGRSHTLGAEKYWAMGDNSANSSDSRYWGTVPQRNVVGPGLFCYWPFTSHWGVIR